MKWALCALALIACATPTATKSPAPVPPCPAREPAPAVSYPRIDCSLYKPPAPLPPVTHDWHCMDVHRPDGSVSGYCFTLATTCEIQRGRMVEKQIGKPTACTTQRIAHCLQTMDNAIMGGQLRCALTAENCTRRRDWFLQELDEVLSHVSECAPTRNTDALQQRWSGTTWR